MMKAQVKMSLAESRPAEEAHWRYWAPVLIVLSLASWTVVLGAARAAYSLL
jgi:hypothetical protein